MKRIIAHHMFCEGAGSNYYLLGTPFSTIVDYGWLFVVSCSGATAISGGLGPLGEQGRLRILDCMYELINLRGIKMHLKKSSSQ